MESEAADTAIIRRATPADGPALSGIAHAAKAHWGYPAKWLASWDALLTIGPPELARYEIYVIEEDGRPLGFSGTLAGAPRWTLEHLWVLPEAMGRGLGRRLVADALARATAAGAAGLEIESDPNAEPFYTRCGARRVGWNAAAIPGAPDRRLPRLELDRLPT
jgi:ribosomal protein S18 acetylase RimI-like enzyme